MEKEKLEEMGLATAPLWWHEVLKENFAGNQSDSDSFHSYEMVSESGIHYIFHSFLTNGIKKEGFTEGIFVQMFVPESRKEDLSEIIVEIGAVLRSFLRKGLEKKAGSEEEINTLETNPEFAGLMTKIDRKIAMEGKACHIDETLPENRKYAGNTNYLVSLVPAGDELVKKYALNKIRETFFKNMSLFDRIRLLASAVNNDLKIAIIREESIITEIAIDVLAERKVVAKEELKIIGEDAEVKEIYGGLMAAIIQANSEDKMKEIFTAYHSMDPLLKAGFLEFSLNHWKLKLGL